MRIEYRLFFGLLKGGWLGWVPRLQVRIESIWSQIDSQIDSHLILEGKIETRKVIENLKNGTSIALMIDQRVSEGKKIEFFHKPALTTTIPAQLINKYQCLLVPIYIERYDNYFFKMKIYKPLEFEKGSSVEKISKTINDILEKILKPKL